jgi:outer membrane protein OmpA-like peptidoglycan-associated protein
MSVMRRLFTFGLLLSLGACVLSEPSGQRYSVFFEPSSAQLDDSAKAVLATAADWAKQHPAMPVTVASYVDPYGSRKAGADFTRLRAQVVIDGLVGNGVLAAGIQRREIGSANFQIDSQESRRVEITVGSP